ncbi:transposase, partial [Pseudomonas sp. TNT2022 ID1025]
MAMRVDKLIVGVDVAKAELVVHHDDRDELIRLKNSKLEIKRWLKQQPRNTALSVEATNIYHLDLVELAHGAGLTVYIIDGFQLSNYRKSVGGRVKTDPSDARLLSRFLKNEGADLRPWSPPPAVYGKLQSLLRRRASLVSARTAMTQSWANEGLLKVAFDTFVKSIDDLDLLIHTRALYEQVRCQV